MFEVWKRRQPAYSPEGVGNSSDSKKESREVASESILKHIPAETFEIAECNYGKLIEPIRALTAEEKEKWKKSRTFGSSGSIPETTGGHVVPGRDYEITRNSTGLQDEQILQVLPHKFFPFDPLPNDIKSPQGSLVIRQLPGNIVAAQRARYRPEAGEGRPGREYLQANTLIIPMNFWQRHASQLADRLANLRANPDLISSPESERKNIDPRVVDTEPHDIPTVEGLNEGARLILESLQSSSRTPIAASPGLFPSEKSFLTALGQAVEVYAYINPNQTPDLKVAIGLANNQKLKGRWITY